MKAALRTEQFLKAYEEYSDAIFRHCYFRIYNQERAKELMQDTFVRTWQYLTKGNEIKNMRAFLYRVANNLIIDESRKKKSFSLEELQEKGFQPRESMAMNKETVDERARLESIIDGKDMIDLLEKIDPAYRDVVIMRYVDDLSPQEIATILGETENAVSVRIHRGLQKIREIVKDT